MILVRVGNVGHRPRRCIRIDENAIVPLNEAGPFVVGGNVLGAADDVPVHGSLAIQLAAHELEKRAHRLLDRLEDVRLEFLERVLHRDRILAVVVLLDNLLIQPVVDPPSQHVRVVRWLDLGASGRGLRCSILPEQLDVLLGGGPGLVDGLGAFGGARLHFLGFALDLFVQTLKGGKDAAFQILLRFEIQVRNSLRFSVLSHPSSWELVVKPAYLGVIAQTLKDARDTSEALVEMVAFAKGVADCLDTI